MKIAEVIDSVGDKELPCIVGLAEVENRWVLEDLTQKMYRLHLYRLLLDLS